MQIGINIAVKRAQTSGPSSAPVNTVAPVISGATTLGSVLTTTNGTWTNSPISYTYQWKRGATNIGTNTNTYTLVAADSAAAITCVVTATNALGSSSATSNTITAPIYSTAFTSTWAVTAGETITLPYEAAGTYSGTIDWGDSSTSTNSYANRTHTYAGAGTYTISITGVTTGFRFANTGSKLNIRTITNWGTLRLGNNSFYFQGCSNLTLTTVAGTLDLTGTTSFVNMFEGCSSITTINNINSWSTGSVTNMSSMFSGCTSFNQALSFNTAAVLDMNAMFAFCSNFNQALSFNTAAVLDMNAMFAYCSNFNQALSFNTGSVTDMNFMFAFCSNFNQALSFNTAAVTNMSSMFSGCTSFNQALSFTTGSVTDMSNMFYNATAFNQALSFNTSVVTDMNSMFSGCTSFNQALSFNTGSVLFMPFMFYNATAFNQNLGSWNVANVSDFEDFMVTKTPATFSTANLNAIYNGWSTQTLQPNISISFGTAKYTAAGAAGRAALIAAPKNWTITDGGL